MEEKRRGEKTEASFMIPYKKQSKNSLSTNQSSGKKGSGGSLSADEIFF